MQTPIRSWEAGLFILTLICCFAVVIGLSQARQVGLQEQDFLNLGLDLRGGVDLTYLAEPPPGSTGITPEMMTGTVEILRKRIDPEGVKEIVLQAVGTDRIVIQVPGESDPERIKSRIGRTAMLRFIDTSDRPNLPEGTVILIEGESSTDPDQAGISADTEVITVPPSKIIVEGSQLKQAGMSMDTDSGNYQVNLTFNKEGGKAFGIFTTKHVGFPFSIILDNRVISSPTIQSPIVGGNGRITGSFTMEEARDLSVLLNSGALPVSLKLLSSQTVGPTLGEQAITTSAESFLIGVALVAIFMIVIYGLMGILADLALVMYSLLTLGAMAAFDATLTLPGIAGFILSIGMAVDSNILVFERMKEELNDGKAFHHAQHLAFERAFPAILDGHLTTIFTGILLYSFGTGTIKGFAVTLILGVLLSMFTSLFLTRIWMTLTLQHKATHNPHLLGPGVKVVNG